VSATGDPRQAAPHPIAEMVTPQTGPLTPGLPVRHCAKHRSTAE
jgi:hypothetical protein